jgi:hypothetical protein
MVDAYELWMIVDDSHNSTSDSLLQTTREDVFDIKSMAQEMVWEREQLQELCKFTKESGLNYFAFAVLGGIPTRTKN